jgi:septal ring factor EnvC (AmiA/AmiB activator)
MNQALYFIGGIAIILLGIIWFFMRKVRRLELRLNKIMKMFETLGADIRQIKGIELDFSVLEDQIEEKGEQLMSQIRQEYGQLESDIENLEKEVEDVNAEMEEIDKRLGETEDKLEAKDEE